MMLAINLTFASPLVVGLCEWSVLEDTYCSDHLEVPIAIKFSHTITSRPFFSHRAKFSTQEWNTFIEKLHINRHLLKVQRPVTSDNAVLNYEIFVKHIKSSFPRRSDPNRSLAASSSKRRELLSSGQPSSARGRTDAKSRSTIDVGCLRILKGIQPFQTILPSKGRKQSLKKLLNRRRERFFCNKLNPSTPIGYMESHQRFKNRRLGFSPPSSSVE